MSDEGLSWHKRWLALDDHRLDLLDTWCDLQRQLERQAGWFDLSNAARAEIEQTSGLSDLDTTLRLIHRRLRHWLRTQPPPAADRAIAELLATVETIIADGERGGGPPSKEPPQNAR